MGGAYPLSGTLQTYYKLSYVDRRIDNPEQRICEDIPKLVDGLGELVGEWCKYAPFLTLHLQGMVYGGPMLVFIVTHWALHPHEGGD